MKRNIQRSAPAKQPALRKLPAPKQNGCLLWDYLEETLRCSRRQAKKLLDERHVFVNGKRIWMTKHPLQKRDVVEVLSQALTAEKKMRPTQFRVLHDDPDFVVIDKPSGILAEGIHSVETGLREQLQNPDIRAVHRLDKDTTGCLLFAKNTATRRTLVAQFKNGDIFKQYHALTAGALDDTEVVIKIPVDGQSAISHVYQVSSTRKAPRCAHMKVVIETGRTHQIRIHLKAAGAPVLGDRQYFNHQSMRFLDVPRQMLHAADLRFTHPVSKAVVHVRSPLPKDFKDWMKRLSLR